MGAKVTVLRVYWDNVYKALNIVSGTSNVQKLGTVIIIDWLVSQNGHKAVFWELQKVVLDFDIQHILKEY